MKRSNQLKEHLQSNQYDFPYHYLPYIDNKCYHFSKKWSFAASYLSFQNILINMFNDGHFEGISNHIDIGCGDGAVANLLIETFNELVKVTGIDYDLRAIRWAKTFSKYPENFICGDIKDLNSVTYESASLIEVFEHIPPVEAVIFVENIAMSLKEGANLIVTVPTIEVPLTPKHYRHFDFKTLQTCFQPHFKVVDKFAFVKTNAVTRNL